MLAIGLSYIIFIMLKYITSIPSFIRDFIMKGCWILLESFLHLLRWSCDFCPCFCLYVVLQLLICICWTIFAFL
jgi:hypothetical protein